MRYPGKSMLAIAFVLASTFVSAQPCNMTGTYTVGPGGNYATIASAITALRNTGLGGPVVLEIRSTYTSINEGLLGFANIPCVSATNTITLRPAVGATNIRIFSNGTVIILSNSNHIIIDGRPGGTGTTSQLRIDCSGATNNALLFGNNSTNNLVQYVRLTGVNNTLTNAPVLFQSGGNSNNIIRNCHISGNGNGHPVIGLYSESNGVKNANNKIENCLFTGYYPNAGQAGIGIYLGKNNEGWEISGNSFYQDIATPQWGPGESVAIFVNDTTSANSVTGNFVGGTEPQCGGQKFLATSDFRGIVMATGRQSYSTVEGNVIRNIRWNKTSNYSGITSFAGIHILSGKVNVNDNTIGRMDQLESILSNSDNGSYIGMDAILVGENSLYTNSDTINIFDNEIGGIRCDPPSATSGNTLRGVHVAQQHTGYVDIYGNTIGSTTLRGSLRSKMIVHGEVLGIEFSTAGFGPIENEDHPVTIRITNNHISHLDGTTTGIRVNGGKPQIVDNRISDINISVNDLTVLSIYGIKVLSARMGTLIKGNRLSNLTLNPQRGSGITGIHLDNARGVLISGNLMHNFQVSPQQLTAVITGIESTSFVNRLNIINNMISLGVDSAGAPSFAPVTLNGIMVTLDTSNISHNSIYVAGTANLDANCLHLTKRNTSICRVTNNILMNVHSQASPNVNSFNCGVKFDPIFTTTLTGLVMNHNLYEVNGLQSFIGSYNNVRHATLASWRTATSNEANSLTGNPNFIKAAGDSVSTDMHLQLPTPADAQGGSEPGVTTDFDGQDRSSLTPVDIGADALASGPPAPGITSFNPQTAASGATITITGTNFINVTAVSFGGTNAASFTVVNPTTITAVVGAGASGSVSVTTASGTASLAGFTFIPAPTIISFNPVSAASGASVTITGTNFTGATSVSFGGTAAASFVVNSSTTITAVVGTGASGSVSVTTPGGTASRAGFTFIPAPTITSFNPTVAVSGTPVTITGTNLTGATSVSFGGTAAASFVVNSSTTITAVVGSGTTGSVTVVTPGGTASLAGFTFTFPTGLINPGGNNSPELTISPNPSSDLIRINHPASPRETRIRFFDLSGREVKQLIPARSSQETRTTVSSMPKGVYRVTWSDGVRILKRNFLVE